MNKLLSLFLFCVLSCSPGWAEEAKATFAGGCYWCTEAIFEQLDGVDEVVAGFMGGDDQGPPSYAQLASGELGHAEVVEIRYDPSKVTFEQLLEVHLETHDPTSVDRQGDDVGHQYRSGIFYHSQEQKEAAESIIRELAEAKVYEKPIVTEVVEASIFYPAKDSHQDYYSRRVDQQYCDLVITPKVEKFRKVFSDRLKASQD